MKLPSVVVILALGTAAADLPAVTFPSPATTFGHDEALLRSSATAVGSWNPPVVDVRAADAASLLDAAMARDGTVCLVGLGIASLSFKELADSSSIVFDHHREELNNLEHARPPFRGFVADNVEVGSRFHASKDVEVQPELDASHKFGFGPAHSADHETDMSMKGNFTAPNVWPKGDGGRFRRAAVNYRVPTKAAIDSVSDLIAEAAGGKVAEAVAEALHTPEVGTLWRVFRYFTATASESTSRTGVGAHSDSSLFNLAASTAIRGLEVGVLRDDGAREWRRVVECPAVPDEQPVLLLVGTILSLVSERRWEPSLHRVMREDGADDSLRGRLTIGSIVVPAMDLPLPMLGEGVTYKQWLKQSLDDFANSDTAMSN